MTPKFRLDIRVADAYEKWFQERLKFEEWKKLGANAPAEFDDKELQAAFKEVCQLKVELVNIEGELAYTARSLWYCIASHHPLLSPRQIYNHYKKMLSDACFPCVGNKHKVTKEKIWKRTFPVWELHEKAQEKRGY